jgi:serine/threonine-protein kinase
MGVDCGSARDRLGQTLSGKYTLLEILGAGGTAVVYRARAQNGVEFAIKVLHDHLSRTEEVRRRFVREGKVGNVLEHPGTVRVRDHGTTDEGCPYLVLELLDGESLEERCARLGGRLPVAEALDYCDQLLEVLELAHARNIIHRDIKPSNLFVTPDGQLKVLDFGVARLVDETIAADAITATKTGQMVGTPAFMPPEQALSRPRDIDARTDLWSVSATVFTLVSGEHVHVAQSSFEQLVKAATLPARSLAYALPGVPAHVEAFVGRGLAFDKADRWASASAMREALADVRANPGRRVGTSTTPPPAERPSLTLATPMALTSVPRLNAGGVEERVSTTDVTLTSSPSIRVRLPKRTWSMAMAVACLSFGLVSIGVALERRNAMRSSASVAAPQRWDAEGASGLPPVTSALGVPAAPPADPVATVAVPKLVVSAAASAAAAAVDGAPKRALPMRKDAGRSPKRP